MVAPACATAPPLLCPVGIWKERGPRLLRSGLAVPFTTTAPFQVSYVRRVPAKAAICSASLNARCAAGQTQTVTRKSPTITKAPPQGKEKSPKLDDGGTGGPRFFGGGGWGGGGDGWGKPSGGFYFFSFLVILGYIKELDEKKHGDDRRRHD